LGARAGKYVHLSGLEHGCQIGAQEAQLRCRHTQSDGPRLSRCQPDTAESPQLEQRTHDARDSVVDEQKDCFLGRLLTLIAYIDSRLQSVALGKLRGIDS